MNNFCYKCLSNFLGALHIVFAPKYRRQIIYGGMEYEFTINAATGAVTEWDAESVYD